MCVCVFAWDRKPPERTVWIESEKERNEHESKFDLYSDWFFFCQLKLKHLNVYAFRWIIVVCASVSFVYIVGKKMYEV